ncbi:LysR family transcriptional regulator [uncultured Paludibaculum sp.]|uniref:LysR family transcriptional regulator n=1 Tax=uncultured Paludibaculum sp. TaxID=1765020 RepID=UPI002AAACA00|nr:LysR family transcriptional regulator [uncultured Paludibaculum sp.]
MEFRELKSLSTLAESGSLSETARLLHLTPAAIHKQLKRLEEELQIPLYERRDGRLRLTSAAQLLLPYLRDILGRYESAVGALEEWKGVRRGLLRIGSGPSLATYLLPPILRRYHERFPNIDLDVQTGNSLQLLSALQGGELDLALVVAPAAVEAAPLEVVVEHVTEIVFVSSRRRAARRSSVRTLGDQPFLLFRKGARIEDLIERYLADHGLTPNVIMRFDSAEVLKTVLVAGVGVSMLPLYTVQDDIRGGRLHRIRQTEASLHMKVHLVAQAGGYVPPAVTEFIDVARQVLANFHHK